MSQNAAYKQLLTLICARSQQWLRHQIDALPSNCGSGDPAISQLAEIATAANICGGFRGSEAPLQSFMRSRLTPEFMATLIEGLEDNQRDRRGMALLRFMPPDRGVALSVTGPLADRLALSDPPGAGLLAEAETFLQRPVLHEALTDDTVDHYARVMMLCYRFGAERPRFSRSRTYGEAFSNCLRMAEWAAGHGRTEPLAQMCFCLGLIDPDHEVSPWLGDLIASQRPDGSFPIRLGFGTANQDGTALRPTLAVLTALHMAIHGRWNAPRPTLPMAA